MFEVLFESSKDDGLTLSGRSYDDTFPKVREAKLDQLDTFIYLADLYKIVSDCTSDLLDLPGGQNTEFWQINKAFIAYLNAVYFFREYANNYSDSVSSIIGKQVKERGKFWLICEFRNHVIHKSVIIKDRAPLSGDVFITRDEICTKVSDNISALKGKKNSQKRIETERWFLSKLSNLSPPVVKTIEAEDYISVKELVRAAKVDLDNLNCRVLEQAFHHDIMPIIEWLLSMIEKVDGQYRFTLVNRRGSTNPDNDEDSLFNPASDLEGFIDEMVQCLGKDNVLCQHVYQLLKEEGYTFDLETDYDIPRLFSAMEKS